MCCRAEIVPQPLDVMLFCRQRADAHARGVAASDDRVRDERAPTTIDALDNRARRVITAAVGENNEVEPRPGHQLKARVSADLINQPVRPGDVTADHRTERLRSLQPQEEPQLQRPEPAAKGICQSR